MKQSDHHNSMHYRSDKSDKYQPEYLNKLRHSAAHLLAAAVLELRSDAKLTIGPAIADGFYYDFAFEKPFLEEELPQIEHKMLELVRDWVGFKKTIVTTAQALAKYQDNPYKQELIKELDAAGEQISFYQVGEFVDLCRGGHIDHPDQELKYFKLTAVAGAYWRGDEKNKMLTRIYGTVWSSQAELDNYLKMQAEAKKRDHRKLGQELDLFVIDERVGKGLILWLPKGNLIKEELEKFAKQTEQTWGYQRVSTPHITKEGLYLTSGHLPYYKDDLFPPMTLDDGQAYYLKPMNCPHHHMIYASRPKSYRDLPLRLAEYGTCYRYESSGELFGLMRVRGFSQNDAHIYCTADQAVDEFVQVMKLHQYFYQALGITDYHLELALRDPKKTAKYHGDDAMWELAEKLMRAAVAQVDIKMVEEVGSAAFYGPKIDFIIKSSIGREFAVSTNQIDLYMGNRFELKYIDSEGVAQTPVIIHRAPLGSHERFIGFLIEHFAGKFPVWMAPVQVKVLPITTDHHQYAAKVVDQLQQNDIRVELDDRAETLSARIRQAQVELVPYMLVVGEREQAANTVAVRQRDGQKQVILPLDELMLKIKHEVANKL